MQGKVVAIDGEAALVEVDLGIYSITALLKAAYWFTGKYFMHLQFKAGSSGKIVEARLWKRSGDQDLTIGTGEFLNALLDQTLREEISKESAATRNLILSHALSKTSFLHNELENNVG